MNYCVLLYGVVLVVVLVCVRFVCLRVLGDVLCDVVGFVVVVGAFLCGCVNRMFA